MNPKKAIIVRGIMRCLPETSFFALKRALWRWAGAKIGSNVRICSSAFILGTGELEISDDTWIGHQVFIETGSKVTIGSCVDVGPRVYIGTGSHRIDTVGEHTAGEGMSKPVSIGNGVWLGANVTILPGVEIGQKVVVGAGSGGTRNVEPYTSALGPPARQLRDIK